MEKFYYLYAIYLCLINLIAFFMFGIDKLKAKKDLYRISEKTLITICAVGGALGGLLGMMIFHHKTSKPKFIITVPLLVLIYGALTLWLMMC